MSRTLLVFEGEKTEIQYFEAIKKHFPFKGEVISIFGGSIYQLYDRLAQDQDLDLWGVLKERQVRNNSKDLVGIKQREISEIYLFFDHDPQDSNATSEKLQDMLNFFDNETSSGKLYISYPMVEALLSNSGEVVIRLPEVRDFKQEVQNRIPIYLNSLNNGELSQEQLKGVFLDHLRKANWVSNDSFSLPACEAITPELLYQGQLSNFISNGLVAVVSAFPLFIDDYFREEFLFYRK